eukprot:scaffold136931_cov32-Tisochrysis_lutea.AAC.3
MRMLPARGPGGEGILRGGLEDGQVSSGLSCRRGRTLAPPSLSLIANGAPSLTASHVRDVRALTRGSSVGSAGESERTMNDEGRKKPLLKRKRFGATSLRLRINFHGSWAAYCGVSAMPPAPPPALPTTTTSP